MWGVRWRMRDYLTPGIRFTAAGAEGHSLRVRSTVAVAGRRVRGAAILGVALAVTTAACAGSPAPGRSRTGSTVPAAGYRFTGISQPRFGQLTDVSCASPVACTVVGSTGPYSAGAGKPGKPLAERWNGRTWTVQAAVSPPHGGELSAVSCLSATDCTAVGSAAQNAPGTKTVPLAEHWNGRAWSVQPTARPARAGELTDVSCVSPVGCIALGAWANQSRTMTQWWDGHTWRLLASPKAIMSGVSCVSARWCLAVGSDMAQDFGVWYETWNGSAWSRLMTPANEKSGGSLTVGAVSCTSPAACTEVGSDFYNGYHGTAARWNGTWWAQQSTYTPSAAQSAGLIDVDCPSARTCLAVGDFTNPADRGLVFSERWNGSAWAALPTPNFRGKDVYMTGVSCLSASACMAVGITQHAGRPGPNSLLAEWWNGSSWKA